MSSFLKINHSMKSTDSCGDEDSLKIRSMPSEDKSYRTTRSASSSTMLSRSNKASMGGRGRSFTDMAMKLNESVESLFVCHSTGGRSKDGKKNDGGVEVELGMEQQEKLYQPYDLTRV